MTDCDNLKSENALLKNCNRALEDKSKLLSDMLKYEETKKKQNNQFFLVECCR